MPFEPGKSGNPSGKPKKSNPASMAAKEYALEAIKFQYDTMSNPEEKTENRLKASEYLITRAWGKPTESVEVSGIDGNPIENTFTVVFKKPDAS